MRYGAQHGGRSRSERAQRPRARAVSVAFALTFVLALTLAFTGCSGGNRNGGVNPEYAKYFTGTEGVSSQFTNFPQKLYYYGPDDNSGNEFSFGVEVQNKGASFSRGAIFISGFDPGMIQFREFAVQGSLPTACGLSLGTIAFGQIGGIFRCDGITIAGNEDLGHVNVDLGRLISGFSEKYGKSWWIPERFNFAYSNQGDTWTLTTDTTNVEYYQHGRLLIAWFAMLDFLKFNGQEFLLAGDTYEWPGGEYAYQVYNGRIANWAPGLDETDQKFLLTSCYLYTTYASPIVCVDPEPYSENRKVCQPQSRSYSGGNGAPVAITSIEQENTPKKIIFHINVKNVGKGQVYDPAWLEKCSPYYPGDRVTPGDLNVVYLGDVRIGSFGLASRGGAGGITCSPEVIRLDPNTKTGSTTCTYPIEFGQVKSAYQTPLTVELWYGYSEIQEKTVRIKRVI